MSKKRPGRPRLYKDSAEKLRVFRAKRKLNRRLGVYPSYTNIRLDIETRKKVETLNPELKDNRPIEENLDTFTEEQFQEYIRANDSSEAVWICPIDDTENFIYKDSCIWCGLDRPNEYDRAAEVFLLKYEVARKWTGIIELLRDKLCSKIGYLDGSISI